MERFKSASKTRCFKISIEKHISYYFNTVLFKPEAII